MERVKTGPPSGGRWAFSLIELLVVVGIIVLLLSLTVPAVNSALEGGELQRSGYLVNDIVTQARQFATALNVPVEARVYQIPVNGEDRWAAFQIWAPEPQDAGGALAPLTRLVVLGSGAAIALNFSPILQQPDGVQGTQNLPAHGGNRNYRGFRMRPDGSLEKFVGSDANYLTLFPARALAATALPPNFFAVQINPYTGTPVVYQP